MKESMEPCGACGDNSWADEENHTNLDCNVPTKTDGKVDLGGMYSSNKPPPKPPPMEKPEERKATQLECGPLSINIQHWDDAVMASYPRGVTNDSVVDFARHQQLSADSRRSASERIVEKFGGLALGFSGPVAETSESSILHYKPNFSAVETGHDSHVKEICKLQASPSRTVRPKAPSQQSIGNLEAAILPTERRKSKINLVIPPISPPEELHHMDVLHKGVDKPGGNGGVHCHMPKTKDEKILKYVKEYNLEVLFEYFLALLCINAPPEPYRFLSKVASEMVESRSYSKGMEAAFERVFETTHIQALFRLFDKERNGYITYTQYKNGMETLGLTRYNRTPEGSDMNKITEETFVSEGIQAVESVLQSFLNIRKLKG